MRWQPSKASPMKCCPPGISSSFTGSAKAFQEAFRSLPILLMITIILIYMILAILYEHYGYPFTILTALPFAGFGALLTLLLFGEELNIFSFVGIILLIGLVKKNGIMMVDFALQCSANRTCCRRMRSSRRAWCGSARS